MVNNLQDKTRQDKTRHLSNIYIQIIYHILKITTNVSV